MTDWVKRLGEMAEGAAAQAAKEQTMLEDTRAHAQELLAIIHADPRIAGGGLVTALVTVAKNMDATTPGWGQQMLGEAVMYLMDAGFLLMGKPQ